MQTLYHIHVLPVLRLGREFELEMDSVFSAIFSTIASKNTEQKRGGLEVNNVAKTKSASPPSRL